MTVREYDAPEVSRAEILRYLRSGEDEVLSERIERCLAAVLPTLSYKACMAEFPIHVSGIEVDLGFARVSSRDLSARLIGCHSVVVFVATVGLGIDRLMTRYGATSPTDALIVSAIGNERVEALCDAVCRDIGKTASERGGACRTRYSPGYGDLDLSVERDIFASLKPTAKIGVALSENLLMTPIKSVSAIVGIMNGEKKNEDN